MKFSLLPITFFLSCQTILAQRTNPQIDTSGIRSIELGEVMIKSKEPEKFGNRVKPQNVFIVLNPTRPGATDTQLDSTYFVTRFPQPEAESISLYAVELKLKPYDTSMFDIKLLIYQVQNGDTLRKTVPIAGEKIDRKGKLRVTLFDEKITLQPGDFYIGYGFHPKHISEAYEYRMYCSNKGNGAMITFQKDKTSIVSDPHIPYVFPFKMSYRKD